MKFQGNNIGGIAMPKKQARLATEKDATELARLNQEFNGGENIAPENIIEHLKTSEELVVVATLDEKVVGFACGQSFHSFCYSSLVGEITELYVEKNARRLGLANMLISLLEKKLNSRGVKSIKILTGTNNEAAIKTYRNSHYEIDDVVVLEKEL